MEECLRWLAGVATPHDVKPPDYRVRIAQSTKSFSDLDRAISIGFRIDLGGGDFRVAEDRRGGLEPKLLAYLCSSRMT